MSNRKGKFKVVCNITRCETGKSATWYNHSTLKFYCSECAERLNSDEFNKMDSQRIFGHELCTEQILNPNKEINKVEDYQNYCEESIDQLIQELLTDTLYSFDLDPTDDGDLALIELGCLRGFNMRAYKLWENLHSRYYNLGQKLFPEDEIEINILGLIEP